MTFKRKLIFLIATIIFDIIIARCYVGATHILINKGESEFQASMSSAVYDALSDELINKPNFEELIRVEYNANKEISFISTDVFKVNTLSKNLAKNTLNYYKKYCSKGVDIPIGAFTGLNFCAGLGKKVNVKLLNVTSVTCEFISNFESVGINQTRHTLYLNVTPDLVVVTMGKRSISSQSVSVLVYDNLIVGKVPSVYLTSQVLGKN